MTTAIGRRSTPPTAALINPPDNPAWRREYNSVPPLGLGYIAAVARDRGHSVELFDLSLETQMDGEVLDRIGLSHFDIYGITTYTETFSTTLRLIRLLKARSPDSLIILGGSHATAADFDILSCFPEIDVVVRHEGEIAFSEILESWSTRELGAIRGLSYRDPSGEPCRTPDREELIDQDALPFPALDYSYRPPRQYRFRHGKAGLIKPTITMCSSRGCPKKCTFCAIIVLSPKWRFRSVDSLMSEVKARYADAAFGHIMFQDANFFVHVTRTLEFARRLHAFDPHITWSGTATADHVVKHADVLAELAKLNCAYIEIGIESGNADSLSRFNKWTTVEQNETALRLLDAVGINVGLDFIMFEPEMTLADLKANLAFYDRTELTGYWPVQQFFQELMLFPGTPLRHRYEQQLGVRFDPHSVPPTPFFDDQVRAAHGLMRTYFERFQIRTNQLVEALTHAVHDAIHLARTAGADPQLIVAIQRAGACIVSLRHLPYRFLQALLDEPNRLSGLSFDEAVTGLGLDTIEDLYSRGSYLLENLDRLISAGRLGSVRQWSIQGSDAAFFYSNPTL